MTDRLKVHTSSTEIARGAEDFALADKKGRAVGFRWSISAIKAEEAPESAMHYYTLPAGHPLEFFRVWGSPTRDGKSYGPAFNTNTVLTMEAAEKKVAERIAGAKKRETKRFAETEVK